MHQATLDKALAQILKDACYTYKIKGHHIIISPSGKKDDPVGRYDIQISYIGYTPYIINEVLLTSSKEIHLDVALNENAHLLNEIVIRPDVKKAEGIWSNQY